MGLNGAERKITSTSSKPNGANNGRPKGRPLLLFLFVPPHQKEPLPETFEVMVSIGRIDHRLGDVVAGLLLASRPPCTEPPSDPIGPSVRSKSPGFHPKGGQKRVGIHAASFRWFLRHTDSNKGGLSVCLRPAKAIKKKVVGRKSQPPQNLLSRKKGFQAWPGNPHLIYRFCSPFSG